MTTPTRGAWTGRQLSGRYEVQEIIGRGGMADVYRGMDARLGRDVAIKVLKSTLSSDKASRERFRKEAMAVSKMAHPTIVRVFDAGDEMDGSEDSPEGQTTPFIVMEHVEGKLLSEIIRRGAIDEAAALGIADGVLTALEISHDAGIVHRDIKPANIMITRTGGVKVMDFGIATAMADQVGTSQAPSSILGTALYLSPEQAQGADATAQSDLYSLGVVLYEMIAGRPPFQAETPVAVAFQHISEDPPPLKLQAPHVTAGTAAIVHKLLDKEPSNRFATATLVRKAMAALPAPGASPSHGTPESKAPEVAKKPERQTPGEPPLLTGSIPQPTWQASQEPSVDLPVPLGGGVQGASVPRLAIGLGSVLAISMLVAIVIWLFTLNPATVINTQAPTIPDLAGSSEQVAVAELTRLGLTPAVVNQVNSDVEVGTVIETIPGPGIRVALGERVQVVVSAGAAQIRIPDVKNLSTDEAVSRLREAGLALGPLQEDYSANLPAGTVLQTTPEAGEEVDPTTEVIVTVSNGLVLVPNVVNLTIGDANPLLTGPNLQLTVILENNPTCTGGVVMSQSLAPGEHPQRSDITLVYCGAVLPEAPPEVPEG